MQLPPIILTNLIPGVASLAVATTGSACLSKQSNLKRDAVAALVGVVAAQIIWAGIHLLFFGGSGAQDGFFAVAELLGGLVINSVASLVGAVAAVVIGQRLKA